MGTAELVNLAVARIAKNASESMLRSAKAMLGAGWRVARVPLEPHELDRERDEHETSVLDELVAVCTLVALIHPKRPAATTDPVRAFLSAERLRSRARLLVTFKHIEAKVLVYEWRPPGARAHTVQPLAPALYTPDDDDGPHKQRARTRDEEREEPETDDLSSTWAVWTELKKLKGMLDTQKQKGGGGCAAAGKCAAACKGPKCDTCVVCKKVDAAYREISRVMRAFGVSDDPGKATTGSGIEVPRRPFPPTHVALKAHTRAMPEYDEPAPAQNNANNNHRIPLDEVDDHFAEVNAARKRGSQRVFALEKYESKLVGTAVGRVGGQTASLQAATEGARAAIREARDEISRQAQARKRKRATTALVGLANVTSRGVIVVSADAERHWALSLATTIGDVWLEARGYTMTVHDHAVHAEFGREPVAIRPMPHAMTHYVVPCVADGERTVYRVPATGGGAMHALVPSAANGRSPIYDLALRAASQTRQDGLRAVTYTFVEPSVDTSFGGDEGEEKKKAAIEAVRGAYTSLKDAHISTRSYVLKALNAATSLLLQTSAAVMKDNAVVDSAFSYVSGMNEDDSDAPEANPLRSALYEYALHYGTPETAKLLSKEDRERALFNGFNPTVENKDKSEATLGKMIALAQTDHGEHFFHTEYVSERGEATLKLLASLNGAYAEDSTDQNDKMTKIAADKYLKFQMQLGERYEEVIAGLYTNWRTGLYWLIRRAPDDIDDDFYESVGKCRWTDTMPPQFFELVQKHGAWLALQFFRCDHFDDCVKVAGGIMKRADIDIASYRALVVNFVALEAYDNRSCIHAINEFFSSVRSLDTDDDNDNSAYVLLSWGAVEMKDDAARRRRGATLLFRHMNSIEKAAIGVHHADLFSLARFYDVSVADKTSTKRTFEVFFGVDFATANGMRRSLRSVVEFAVQSVTGNKNGAKRLVFEKNEFGHLRLAAFRDEWQSFIDDSDPLMNEPGTIASNIKMLTVYPNVNEDVSVCTELLLKKYHADITRTLAIIRASGEAETTRRLHRTKLVVLVKTEHGTVLPSSPAAKCELRTMHLLELANGKQDKNNRNETILDYIVGCECKECFYTVVERWDESRRPGTLAYEEFLRRMKTRTSDPELDASRLVWRKQGCTEALVSLCKKDLRSRNNTAMETVKQKCTKPSDAKKVALLKTQVARCDNDTVRAMSDDTADLPDHANGEKVSDLKKRVSTEAGSYTILGELLGATSQGADMEYEGALLPYVDVNFIFACGSKTRFRYISALLGLITNDKFQTTLAFSSLTVPRVQSNSKFSFLHGKVDLPSALRAYHWLTFANEITRYSRQRPDAAELSSALRRLEPAFKDSLRPWEEKETDLISEDPKGADTSELAQAYYGHVTKGANDVAGKRALAGEMDSAISDYVQKVANANAGEGWTPERGVLQLWLILDIPLLAAISENVGAYVEYGDHTSWLLHRSLLRRNRFVARTIESGSVSLQITSGDITSTPESISKNVSGAQRLAADGRSASQKDVARILTAMNGGKEDFERERDTANKTTARVEAGGQVNPGTISMYRFLRSELETYKLLLTDTDKEAAATLRGRIRLMILACPDEDAVSAHLHLMKVTRPLNKQPSKLREFIEAASDLDENQKRLILESATVGDADKALTRFGGRRASELIKAFINKVEEMQERPLTQTINAKTPIATGRSGFVTLAFFHGGLYQLLRSGVWIRVLAGAYGEETYSHRASFYYTAQALMEVRGASRIAAESTSAAGVGRMRRDLGISIFESKVKSDVVAAMMREKDKARSTSSLLWRLPCDGACDCIVYLCCDYTPSSAVSVFDVITLVVDAETSRFLERYVARDATTSRPGTGVGPREAMRGVMRKIRTFAADFAVSKFDSFEIKLERSRRSLDTAERPDAARASKPYKELGHATIRRPGLKEDWSVLVPEIGLLYCFPVVEGKTTDAIAKRAASSLVEKAGIPSRQRENAVKLLTKKVEALDPARANAAQSVEDG